MKERNNVSIPRSPQEVQGGASRQERSNNQPAGSASGASGANDTGGRTDNAERWYQRNVASERILAATNQRIDADKFWRDVYRQQFERLYSGWRNASAYDGQFVSYINCDYADLEPKTANSADQSRDASGAGSRILPLWYRERKPLWVHPDFRTECLGEYIRQWHDEYIDCYDSRHRHFGRIADRPGVPSSADKGVAVSENAIKVDVNTIMGADAVDAVERLDRALVAARKERDEAKALAAAETKARVAADERLKTIYASLGGEARVLPYYGQGQFVVSIANGKLNFNETRFNETRTSVFESAKQREAQQAELSKARENAEALRLRAEQAERQVANQKVRIEEAWKEHNELRLKVSKLQSDNEKLTQSVAANFADAIKQFYTIGIKTL